MNVIRMVLIAVLALCSLFMLINVGWYVYEMANYPGYEDQEPFHWTIRVVTWITYFLMGVVMLAAAVLLPGWWRKGLAAWGMFTCFVMVVLAIFIPSNNGSFEVDEVGLIWVVAGLWLSFLFAVMAVAAYFGRTKPKTEPLATAQAIGAGPGAAATPVNTTGT
jgi:hypothetical protein